MPPGVDVGTRIRLAGQGEAGQRGSPPGDMYVEIAIARHEMFHREGTELAAEIAISFPLAALGGARSNVPTIEGGNRAERSGRDAAGNSVLRNLGPRPAVTEVKETRRPAHNPSNVRTPEARISQAARAFRAARRRGRRCDIRRLGVAVAMVYFRRIWRFPAGPIEGCLRLASESPMCIPSGVRICFALGQDNGRDAARCGRVGLARPRAGRVPGALRWSNTGNAVDLVGYIQARERAGLPHIPESKDESVEAAKIHGHGDRVSVRLAFVVDEDWATSWKT